MDVIFPIRLELMVLRLEKNASQTVQQSPNGIRDEIRQIVFLPRITQLPVILGTGVVVMVGQNVRTDVRQTAALCRPYPTLIVPISVGREIDLPFACPYDCASGM